MILLFNNLAATTLQSGINASATTLTLATGTGTEFPEPAAGEAFYLTLKDASTQQIVEVVLVTARSSDVCTVVRAQQNTTALTWNAGDIAAQLVTAGDAAAMLQPDVLQENTWGSCIASGTNSLTATLPSGLTSLPAFLSFTLQAAGANTGAVTLTLTLGSTVLSAYPVQKFGGSALNAGDIPAAGFPMELVWSPVIGAYILTNPATGTAGSIAGGAANELVVQTAPGTTGFVAAPTIAGTVLAWTGSALAWLAAAVTSFNGRSGAVVPTTGDYTAAQVGAVATTAFSGSNIHLAQPMFMVLPNGAILQGGQIAVPNNVATGISFPKIFPTACVSVVVSCNNQSSAIRVDSLTTSGFVVDVNANSITWQAMGY